jgi:hypothetical protein
MHLCNIKKTSVRSFLLKVNVFHFSLVYFKTDENEKHIILSINFSHMLEVDALKREAGWEFDSF